MLSYVLHSWQTSKPWISKADVFTISFLECVFPHASCWKSHMPKTYSSSTSGWWVWPHTSPLPRQKYLTQQHALAHCGSRLGCLLLWSISCCLTLLPSLTTLKGCPSVLMVKHWHITGICIPFSGQVPRKHDPRQMGFQEQGYLCFKQPLTAECLEIKETIHQQYSQS